MTGKNQHHIPQCLQRGFLFTKKQEKTFVFRGVGPGCLERIKDVSSDEYFYSYPSDGGTKTLDEQITDYENRLGILLGKLRSAEINETVDACLAAEVVAHLTPRSAHTRKTFVYGAKRAMTLVKETIADQNSMAFLLGLEAPEPAKTWHDRVAGFLEEHPHIKLKLEALAIPEELLDRVMFMAVKEQFIISFGTMNSGFMDAFGGMFDGLEELVRESHNKSLGKAVIAESHKTLLSALNWKIRAAPLEGAILPDCVALGLGKEGTQFLPYLMTPSASVLVVIMPISTKKLLVGTRGDVFFPDLSNFNSDAVACSNELFIAAKQAPIFAELGISKGERWKDEVETNLQTAIKAALPIEYSSIAPLGKVSQLSQLGYQLTFVGFKAGDDMMQICDRTQILVSEIRPLFNLNRLDGITFTNDFQETLMGLDRGFDTSVSPERLPDSIANGAATALIVRDNVTKIRIILDAEYGLSLVGKEPQDEEVAAHVIVAGLVQACTLSQIENDLPGFLLEPVLKRDHDGFLHFGVRKALRAYRYAHDSAEFGAGAILEEELSKHLIAALRGTYEIIAKAKDAHSKIQNFPELFEVSLEAVEYTLNSVARFIGHRHGLGKIDAPAADTEVGSALASRQLTSWVEVFAKDISKFWQKNFWTKADFYALNIHVERLLWANGILVWRNPSGLGSLIMPIPNPE